MSTSETMTPVHVTACKQEITRRVLQWPSIHPTLGDVQMSRWAILWFGTRAMSCDTKELFLEIRAANNTRQNIFSHSGCD